MNSLEFRASDLRYYSTQALRTLEDSIKGAIRKETRTVYDKELVAKLDSKLKRVRKEKLRRNGISPAYE